MPEPTKNALALTPEELQSSMGFEAFMKEFSESSAFGAILEPIKKMFDVEALEKKIDQVLANQKLIVKGINDLIKAQNNGRK